MRRDDVPLTGFGSSKAQALLCYLAVSGQPHARSALAGLLWADMTDAAALMNLRQVLTRLRRVVGAHLTITRQTLAFNQNSNYWLDVDAFLAGVGGTSSEVDIARLHEAVELYQGDFLAGFFVRDAPLFEAWQLAQRAELRTTMLGALQQMAAYYIQHSDDERGIVIIRRLLDLEPWHEEAHRQLMLLLARSGQRSAAWRNTRFVGNCCKKNWALSQVTKQPPSMNK